MPDPSINVGLGWVVRTSDGEYANGFEQHVADDHVKDDAETFQVYVSNAMGAADLAVNAYRYGFGLNGVAMVAATTVKEADGWVANHAQLEPDEVKVSAARTELMQALDALDWDGATLADPQWLVLVAYG
jgi:hypothetical protein